MKIAFLLGVLGVVGTAGAYSIVAARPFLPIKTAAALVAHRRVPFRIHFMLAMFSPAATSSFLPEPSLADSPWTRGSMVASDTALTIRFALKEQNIDRVKQIATEVNDPAHPSYGQFLARAELAALTAPKPDDVRTVTGWLAGHGDVSVDQQVATLRTTAKAAGALLGGATFFRWFNPVTQQRAVRAGDVRIPKAVASAVAAVYGLHGTPAPPRPAALGQAAPKPEWGPAPAQAAVTPAALRARYGVAEGGVTPTGSTVNRQAVAEFQGQQMNATDLKNFFSRFVPDAAPGDDTVYKYVGTGGAQGHAGGVEASLDIQPVQILQSSGSARTQHISQLRPRRSFAECCALLRQVHHGRGASHQDRVLVLWLG